MFRHPALSEYTKNNEIRYVTKKRYAYIERYLLYMQYLGKIKTKTIESSYNDQCNDNIISQQSVGLQPIVEPYTVYRCKRVR